ncbi:MAG: hypothetical protein WEB33_01860 [Bacteroidota bacterium]
MLTSSYRILILSSCLCFLVLFGCKDNPVEGDPSSENISNGRISITNNPGDLSARITYYDDRDVNLDTTVAPQPGMLAKSMAPLIMKYRAQVSPPSVNGSTLQATHIILVGSYAFVTYNMVGSSYLGGVDVFDVSNKNKPTLISQALFNQSDVSAVTYADGKLYLAESTSDTAFLYTAVVEEITLSDNKLSLTSRRVGLTSFVATDLSVSGGKLFATSGSGGPATGGLSVIDLATFTVTASDPFLDARSIDLYGTTAYVLQGTPARLRSYNTANNAFLGSIDVGGANIPESKSTVKITLDRAFVASGDEGTKVVNLPSGTLIDSLPRVTVVGLDPGLTVTNAVSIYKDLVFMANGEAGVYVAQAAVDLETVPTTDPNLTIRGKMQFGTAESANFVASNNAVVFVATGLGGLNIVEILNY